MILAVLTAPALDCRLAKQEPLVVIRRDPSRAMLAAVRSSQMSMFGDLPGGGESSYFTRSAASLARHTVSEVGGDFDPQLDETGKRLVFASTRHNRHPDLYFKRVNGVAVTQLTGDPASDIQPALSPDGSKVAFASDRTGSWDIWVVDINGGAPMRLTDSPADEVHPSWSPDGTQLIYCSLRAVSGQWELWITDARSGGHRRFIGYGLFPQWSPVNDTILFQRARERGSRAFGVWTLTLVDGDPRYPTELISGAGEAMTLPAWSHDGREVAFVRTSVWPANTGTGPEWSGNSDIWIMSIEGRNPVRLTDGYTGNHSPVFAPDGSVFFTSDRAGHENIWSIRRYAQSAAGDGARPVERSTHFEHKPIQTSASPAASTVRGAEGL